MNKKERLLLAIGDIDEKYIKEAEFKMRTASIIKVAVILTVIIALSLYLFIPFAPVTSDLSDYEGSSYFPLIEGIDEYRLSFMQPRYKNNFQWLGAGIVDLFDFSLKGGMDMAPTDNNAAKDEGFMENGSYVESTDNQVGGVIESDLFKMTDKYIFRLGEGNLRVYSIEKENSSLISKFEIPTFQAEYGGSAQMYLSLDCRTVTVLKQIFDNNGNPGVGIISLDVSDVNNISVKGMVSIDGSYNTSRMVDGKLLLVTDFSFNRNKVEYDDPTTFVPTIDRGNGAEPIEFEDIIYPDEVTTTNYSVVAMLNAESLASLGEVALLNYTSSVYVSAENLYISREYISKTEDGNTVYSSNMSDIAVLNYSGETLEKKGIITVRGWTEDQYSFDELDGYLRVVTSTRDTAQTEKGKNVSMSPTSENVSLYIFDLTDNSLDYKVEDFAIEGEEATAVRFDGDKLYVCTAVVVKFTDPVYFFDLSDYENIGSVDTGVIEGYSDHLINYGEGLLLGIGRENWSYGKVEIYIEQGSEVTSIHEYKFNGEYSLDYKSYLVNRENNLFGFGVDYFYEHDEQTGYGKSYQRYVLLRFDADNMTIYTFDIPDMRADRVRAAYIDGYLYITTERDLIVKEIK